MAGEVLVYTWVGRYSCTHGWGGSHEHMGAWGGTRVHMGAWGGTRVHTGWEVLVCTWVWKVLVYT